MIRFITVVCLGLAPALLSAKLDDEKPAIADGNYRLNVYSSGAIEITYGILKLQNADGKLTGKLIATHPSMKGLSLKSIKLDGNELRIDIKGRTGDENFIGIVTGSDSILGSHATDRRISIARLIKTDLKELTARDAIVRLDIPPAQEIAALNAKSAQLRFKARKEEDEDKKADLLEQAKKAAKDAARQMPKLYQKILDDYSDSPAALDAAISLLRDAGKRLLELDQVKHLVQAAEKTASPYGPRMVRDTRMQVGEVLATLKDHAGFTLQFAQNLEKTVSDKDPLPTQIRALKIRREGEARAGKKDEYQRTLARIGKLDAVLDDEYHHKVPPFSADKFQGRTKSSQRAVVMELFTGAQCGPCVAADVAFDVLQKTYQPTELILLQYHLHIPGPDPLTNADNEARWKYYGDAFPEDVLGTPTAVFNGQPETSGGGSMRDSEAKYVEYRETIEPLLAEPALAKLDVTATRKGDQISIQVNIADVKNPSGYKKLRLVLVEDSIRYLGSNGIRFHHQVVRAFPGGVQGNPLEEASSKHTASVDLKEVRKSLTSYLDESAKERPFPYLDRPLDLDKLRIVAIVQDDQTCEILQGVQTDIQGK